MLEPKSYVDPALHLRNSTFQAASTPPAPTANTPPYSVGSAEGDSQTEANSSHVQLLQWVLPDRRQTTDERDLHRKERLSTAVEDTLTERSPQETSTLEEIRFLQVLPDEFHFLSGQKQRFRSQRPIEER
ncbi:hypothetical protein V7S43_013210 [Phytophthora oleae]|uniref:Uncharacterized protein n=1 Tax=Phytophthora oleae TaxID=2107226 RepID=A0ABD3F623_9STRA